LKTNHGKSENEKENKMSNVCIHLDNGYWLSIIQEQTDKNKVEVALLDNSGFVNTRYWYYTNIKFDDDYDDEGFMFSYLTCRDMRQVSKILKRFPSNAKLITENPRMKRRIK